MAVDGSEMNDWRTFINSGLLDKDTEEARYRQSLEDKIAKLERELFDYQHTMGLLLIDEKKYTRENEVLGELLVETREILKREQAAHLMVQSEAKHREESLRKALHSEKQCVDELEQALCEIHAEHEQVRVTSERKLANANELVTDIEGKSQEVEEKLIAASAKLAEASRRTSELERKLQEVETRDSVLQKELMSLSSERIAHEATIRRHKEDLHEWERKLQETEEKLNEDSRTILKREDIINELNRNNKLKEKELEETEKKTELTRRALKEKEETIDARLSEILSKEKDVESLRSKLEIKEKELHVLAENISVKEKVEIQNVLVEHRAMLDRKKQEFDFEMEEERKAFYNDMRGQEEALQNKELEVKHIEEKLGKREQALEMKSERHKEKDNDLETRTKALEEKEISLKAAENRLEVEKREIIADKDSLFALKDELEELKTNTNQRRLQIHEETEKLRVTGEERAEHLRLQSELKEELEKYRTQKELLLKEHEDLKNDRKKFEEEWEALNERRTFVYEEVKKLDEEKEKLEKFRTAEEDRLEKEKLTAKEYIKRELEAARIDKELVATTMKHEQSVLSDRAQNEHTQLHHEFEMRKKDLETDVQKKKDEMVKILQDKERAFEEIRENELKNISHLKGIVQSEMEELKLERSRIEKDKQEIGLNKKELEVHQLGMHKDINDLGTISKNLKEQREKFAEERNRFLGFVESLQNCKNCGDVAQNFLLSDMFVEMDDCQQLPLTGLETDHFQSSQDEAVLNSRSRISWLQKCTSKIFKLTPVKFEQGSASQDVKSPVSADFATLPTSGAVNPKNVINNSSDALLQASACKTREVDVRNTPYSETQSYMENKQEEFQEVSQQSEIKSVQNKRGTKTKARVSRTPPVKAVVDEDSKKIMGENSEQQKLIDQQPNESSYMSASMGDSSRTELAPGNSQRKRRLSESQQDDCDSEAHSGSVTTAGRRKRRQTITPALQTTPGEKRYNLRRHKP
ncbi:nuclear matrix constituent protein 1-like isoform X2 [Impatiens glandulifera]|nr:nuclear matrix constituent protein 1-like isoform X2 [Impatiens glandulifera]